MEKELTAFRIERTLLIGLRHIKTRTGLPIAMQVNLALRAWLKHPVLPLTPTAQETDNGKKHRRA